jgi:transglutaminase superfamily protein
MSFDNRVVDSRRDSAPKNFATMRENSAREYKYVLAHDVYVCKLDDAAVFLDLRANQYFAVPPESIAALDEMVEGFCTLSAASPRRRSSESSAESTIESLVSRGILTESRDAGVPARRVTISASQAIAPGQRSNSVRAIHGSHLAFFIGALCDALFHVHLNRLKPLLDRIRVLQAQSGEASGPSRLDAVLELLEVFRRLRTFFYTAKDFCLVDALTLTLFLHKYEHAPTFVIGIRTKPFVAHAWVQVGNCIIDDRIEASQGFTPILTV